MLLADSLSGFSSFMQSGNTGTMLSGPTASTAFAPMTYRSTVPKVRTVLGWSVNLLDVITVTSFEKLGQDLEADSICTCEILHWPAVWPACIELYVHVSLSVQTL